MRSIELRGTDFELTAKSRRRPGLRALYGDRRGVTALEFGIVAAPLFALLVAILQTSLVFFSQETLESVAESASRQLMVGSAQKSGTSQAQFKSVVCSKLPVFMKCANVLVDVQTADKFDDVNTASPTITYDSKGNVTNTWKYQPGAPGDIVVMRTMYQMPVIEGPLGFDLSNLSTGGRLLVATSVFKTEPYTS